MGSWGQDEGLRLPHLVTVPHVVLSLQRGLQGLSTKYTSLSLPPTNGHRVHRRPGSHYCPKVKPRAAACDKFVSSVGRGRGEQAGTRVQNAGTRVPVVVELCQRRGTSRYKKRVHRETHAPCCTRRKKKKKKKKKQKGTTCETGAVHAVGGGSACVQCVVRMEKSCRTSACQAKCAKYPCLTLTHFSLLLLCIIHLLSIYLSPCRAVANLNSVTVY